MCNIYQTFVKYDKARYDLLLIHSENVRFVVHLTFSLSQTETTLCRRFTVFVTKYNLMSRDNLIVPILEDESAGQGESEA